MRLFWLIVGILPKPTLRWASYRPISQVLATSSERSFWISRNLSIKSANSVRHRRLDRHRSDWAAENNERGVVQTDPANWDYRHQLLAARHLSARSVFWLVKLMEVVVHLRPRTLLRILAHPDIRANLRWCFRNSFRVWRAEIIEFLQSPPDVRPQMSLGEWLRRDSKKAPLPTEGRNKSSAKSYAKGERKENLCDPPQIFSGFLMRRGLRLSRMCRRTSPVPAGSMTGVLFPGFFMC